MRYLLSMYFLLNCLIVFPASRGRAGFQLRQVLSVEVELGWEKPMGKAIIHLPFSGYFKDRQDDQTEEVSQALQVDMQTLIKRDDPVEIWLGANGNLKLEFQGYVSRVKPQIPLVIECEDEMRRLSQRSVSVSLPAVRLPQLLKTILPEGMSYEAIDVEIGKVVAKDVSVMKILSALKERGIVSYFKGKKLYCGKVYLSNTERKSVARLRFRYNIFNDGLEYRQKEDYRLKVVATSKLKKGKSLKVEVGDEGGQKINLRFTGIESESVLKEHAQRAFDLKTVEGFSGTLTVHGTAQINHTDVIQLEGGRYGQMVNTLYFVDSVKVEFSPSGFRRVCTLGRRLSL